MDEIVKQALIKWPNVPHCYGWLGLDARGNWYMRDDRAQAAGPFASGAPGAKGSLLRHDKLIEFIARNYAPDAQGQWAFQNGPQRVYVELQATPWVWRVAADLDLGLSDSAPAQVSTHTGLLAKPLSCWLDESGRVYLQTDIGFGLVHTQDMLAVAQAVEQGHWVPQAVLAGELPARFAYVPSPQAAAAAAQAHAAQKAP